MEAQRCFGFAVLFFAGIEKTQDAGGIANSS
jgi:hypothetical protein